MIIGIASVDKNFAIGRLNKDTNKHELLFNIKEDMQFFRDATAGHIVVFGRNTYLSLSKQPLPNRTNVVLCSPGIDFENCLCIHSLQELVEYVKEHSEEDVFICGGQRLYESFLPYYDRIYVTKVNAVAKDADAYFPNIDNIHDFKAIDSVELTSPDAPIQAVLCTYDRK